MYAHTYVLHRARVVGRAVDPHSFYPDPAVFLNADPGFQVQVQLNQIWRKKSWRVFLSCKKPKRLLINKKQWSLCKFTFKKLNKVAVISNFLAFFQSLVDKFTLLDPDPHIESGSRRENECGSGSTALVVGLNGYFETGGRMKVGMKDARQEKCRTGIRHKNLFCPIAHTVSSWGCGGTN